MEIITLRNYDEISNYVSNLIAEKISCKPNLCLGLATGSTPLGVYRNLISLNKEGLSFKLVRTINLDEYVGLSADHSQSYNFFMWNNLFNYIDIPKENINLINGCAENLEQECLRYDNIIKKEQIDVQLLGIGENGHIAFNEPADKLELNTHIVNLTEETICVNSRFFDSVNDVPKRAITMGIGSIMSAKKIILMANGKKKSKAIKKLINEKLLDPHFPASYLLLHKDVTVVVDEEACL